MIADTKVLLLVGGRGTRLRSVVPSAPKPLASVGDRSFLELLVRQLRNQGFSNLVMCSGYLADQIEGEFGDGSNFGVSIAYSRESSPMGTGGAVKLAARTQLQTPSNFLVMNGDSFIEIDLKKFLSFHLLNRNLVTMAVRSVENAGRYGTVQLGENERITGFNEKTGIDAPGLVNAGVYAFNDEVLENFPDGPFNLEQDVFPQLVQKGIYAQKTEGMFIDIGTPEDYARAQQISERLYDAAGHSNTLR